MNINIKGKNHVTVEELAERLGMTEWWLRSLARREVIPAVKVGRRWWFNVDEVFQALQGLPRHEHEQHDKLAGL